MKKIFTLLLLFCSYFTNAQHVCGADEARKKLITQDHTYKRSIELLDANLRTYIENNPPSSNGVAGVAATLYYIPVVVHVVYDGPANATLPAASQITGAINYVNAVYDGTWTGAGGAIVGVGDIQIKFVLATKDPNNNTTNGIDRFDGSGTAGYSASGMKLSGATGAAELTIKNLSRWDPEKYYNIWLVNKIDGCTGVFCNCPCDAGYTAGFAYFPFANNSTASSFGLDGTIILQSQFIAGNNVLPHELGHMFSLYHVFEGNTTSNTCPVNTTPASDGDRIADTDPVTDPTLSPNATPFACRTGANNPCNGTPFNISTESNFMNYTECNTLFSSNQKTRMLAAAASSQRVSLTSSWANNQGVYPAPWVAPIAATSTPVSSPLILTTRTNVAGIMNVNLNGITTYSLNATQDGGYLNNATKWYDAFVVNANTTYTMTVNILNGTNASQLGVWIDYNNDGTFNNTTEQLYLQTNIAGTTTSIPITFTTPTNWAKNKFVRLRISQDLSTVFGITAVSNTSTTLAYGQAEDYAVFLNLGSVLPVKITSFEGKEVNKKINLFWKTTSEINTEKFEILKSTTGNDFGKIGTVGAANNAYGADYTFIDDEILSAKQKTYYRLKIIDFNGSFEYSDIVTFDKSAQNKPIVRNNPFTNELKIALPANAVKVQYALYDAAGKILFQKKGLASQNEILLVGFLTNGVYILETIVDGIKYTEKVIKY
jgi:Pregnancy-associated plasma protein-A/GEVED domain